MYPWKAKKLKVGDVVFWTKDGAKNPGVVSKKRYNTVWITWESDTEPTRFFVDQMTDIHTQAQLDHLAEEKKMIATMEEVKKEQMNRPVKW
jgi:hypothetical protein